MTRLHAVPDATKQDNRFPYKLMSALREHRALLGLGPNHILVIWALGTRGLKSWPDAETLAEDTGLGVRTVERTLADLKRMKLLATTPHGRTTIKDLTRLRDRLDDLRQAGGSGDGTSARLAEDHRHTGGPTSATQAEEVVKEKKKTEVGPARFSDYLERAISHHTDAWSERAINDTIGELSLIYLRNTGDLPTSEESDEAVLHLRRLFADQERTKAVR